MICQNYRKGLGAKLPTLNNRLKQKLDTKGFKRVEMAIPFLVDMVTKDKVFPANSIGQTTTIVPMSIGLKYTASLRQSVLTEISESRNTDSEASEFQKDQKVWNIRHKTTLKNNFRSVFSRTRTVIKPQTSEEERPQRNVRHQSTIRRQNQQKQEHANIEITDKATRKTQRTMTEQGRSRSKLKKIQKPQSPPEPIIEQPTQNIIDVVNTKRISKLSVLRMKRRNNSKQVSTSSSQSSKHSSISNKSKQNKIQRNCSVFMQQAIKHIEQRRQVQILEELQQIQDTHKEIKANMSIQPNNSTAQPSPVRTLSLLTNSPNNQQTSQNMSFTKQHQTMSQSFNPSFTHLIGKQNISLAEPTNELEAQNCQKSQDLLSMLTVDQSRSQRGIEANNLKAFIMAENNKKENPYKIGKHTRDSQQSRGSFDYSLLILNEQSKSDEVKQQNPIYKLLNCLHRQIHMTKSRQMDAIRPLPKPIVRTIKKKIQEEPEEYKNTVREYFELRQARRQYFSAETKFISLVQEVGRGFQHLKQK